MKYLLNIVDGILSTAFATVFAAHFGVSQWMILVAFWVGALYGMIRWGIIPLFLEDKR